MDREEVLVLGGMGAIGSCLAHTLVSLGADVTIFDNMMKNTGANIANIKEIKDRVKFIKGDIRDMGELEKVIREKQIIFSCAAQVSHVLSMEDPFLDIDINCRGHIRILECCRKYNPTAKIVYTGTRSQFGATTKLPISEECLDNPTDVYSTNKLASELYHIIYHRIHGLATTSLRLTNTYGSRAQMNNPGYNVVNWLIGKAIQDEDLTVFEPGTQLRDINYVQDVVDAMILAGQREEAIGKVFLLGSGEGISLRDLSEKIVKITGTGRVKMVPWPEDRKKIEVGDIVIDFSKVREALEWVPRTSVEDGIRETVKFYRERFEDYF
ncbi:MAG: SDR family NAD(P)-dependent oxidoreductase [Nanoarchaeota archaeon]|nr:SDR family NAD(P)-dependent oxidoreductase [Nanoarchaeota archaeon]